MSSAPAGRLYGSAGLQSQFIKRQFARIVRNPTFQHEAPKRSICTDIIKSMIMNADMTDMRSHELPRPLTSPLQKRILSGGIKLQERGTELKPLCPFRPSLGGVTPLDREHQRSLFRTPGLVNGIQTSGTPFPHPVNRGEQVGILQSGIKLNHLFARR